MKDAETVANFTLEVLTNFGVPPCCSTCRPHHAALAADGQPGIASGHPKWIARMTSGLRS